METGFRRVCKSAALEKWLRNFWLFKFLPQSLFLFFLTCPTGRCEVVMGWQVRNPLPTHRWLLDVACNANTIVAVGQNVIVSGDGNSWTNISTTDSFSAVTWGGDKFVVMGGKSNNVSSDGLHWDTFPSPLIKPKRLAWNGAKFVAVGEEYAKIASSEDGINWKVHTLQPPACCRYCVSSRYSDVIWTGNRFVAVGSGMARSTDGENWDPVCGFCEFYRGAASSEGLNIAVANVSRSYPCSGTNDVIFSWRDGEVGTFQNVSGAFSGVAGHKNEFIVITSSGVILARSTGYKPVYRTPQFTWLTRITYGDNFGYVTVGSGGTILTSPDGLNWTDRSMAVTHSTLNKVIWTGTQFIAVGTEGSVLTSPDGVRWTLRATGDQKHLFAVAKGASNYVAVGTGGIIMESPDSVSWNEINSPVAANLYSVAWGNGKFVAAGENGTIITSPDARVWTARNSGSTGTFTKVIWNGKIFLVKGDGIFASQDGVIWRSRSSPISTVHHLSWNGTHFLALGPNSSSSTPTPCFRSPDGSNWSPVTEFPVELKAEELIAAGGSFFIKGWRPGNPYTEPVIFSSRDGLSWLLEKSWSELSVDRIAWNGNSFVGVGRDGLIAQLYVEPDVPRLSATRTSEGVILSWAESAGPYLPQTATDLGDTNFWSPINQLTETAAGEKRVIVSVSDSVRFYRLSYNGESF